VNKAKPKPRSWLTNPTNAGDEKFPWKVGCEEQERGKSFKASLRLSIMHWIPGIQRVQDVDVDVVKWRAQANASMPASYIPK